MAWSPDGKRILAGTDDFAAKVWDADKGQDLLSLVHSGGVASVAWSPDGKRIVTGRMSSGIGGMGNMDFAKVWDAEAGQEVFSLTGHKAGVGGVAWGPTARASSREATTAR